MVFLKSVLAALIVISFFLLLKDFLFKKRPSSKCLKKDNYNFDDREDLKEAVDTIDQLLGNKPQASYRNPSSKARD